MNQDIIAMAREAGAWAQQSKNCDVEYVMSGQSLERFATLVADAERESCSRMRATKPRELKPVGMGTWSKSSPESIEAAIGAKPVPLYTSPPAPNQCKFPLCHNEDYQQALAEQIKQELYTGEPAQRKPLEIGDESAAFKEWFNAWWVGDGDICKAVTNEVEQTRSYKSQYTLAFGAWMAAKHAANGIKENV